jgi:hypothetical protein
MEKFNLAKAATRAAAKAETVLISKGNRKLAEDWLFSSAAWEQTCLHTGRTGNWCLPRR